MQQVNTSRRTSAKQRFLRNRKTQGVLLFVLFFALVLCFGLALLLGEDRQYSENENRKLAQAPEFSADALTSGSYTADLERYVTDQFAGRDFWISLKLWADRLTGKRESNGVYLADNGYLMEMPDTPNAEGVTRNLAAINSFAAQHNDLHIFMSVVPNAFYVMADKLPKNAPVRDQKADLEMIRNGLENVTFLDVTDALQQHKDEPIYYRTDHHWTSLGAYYAFCSMAERLGIPSAVQNYTIYTVSTTFEGTLSSKSGSHSSRDTIEIYAPQTSVQYAVTYTDTQNTVCSLYSRECLDAKDQYTVFFGGNHPRIDIATTADTGKNLLLFKDSYANCFVQFLTPYYDNIIMIDPRYYYDSVDSLISRKGITDVLFLYNANTYLADTSLADVLLSGEAPQE